MISYNGVVRSSKRVLNEVCIAWKTMFANVCVDIWHCLTCLGCLDNRELRAVNEQLVIAQMNADMTQKVAARPKTTSTIDWEESEDEDDDDNNSNRMQTKPPAPPQSGLVTPRTEQTARVTNNGKYDVLVMQWHKHSTYFNMAQSSK